MRRQHATAPIGCAAKRLFEVSNFLPRSSHFGNPHVALLRKRFSRAKNRQRATRTIGNGFALADKLVYRVLPGGTNEFRCCLYRAMIPDRNKLAYSSELGDLPQIVQGCLERRLSAGAFVVSDPFFYLDCP